MIDVRRAFTKWAYLLVLTGVLSLSVAEGSAELIAVSALLSGLAYHTSERLGKPIGRTTTNFLVALVLVLMPLDFASLSMGDPVLTVTHFLLAVQLVKLFGPKQDRDYLQLFVVSLIHLGVAAVLTIDLAFSVAFVIYLVVAGITLALFQMKRELDEIKEKLKIDERSLVKPPPRLAGLVTLAALGTLGLTVVFFFGFPRISAVLFDLQRKQSRARVGGFTDQIGLNDLSEIHENTEVVLQVAIERAGSRLPEMPKWRGLAFDRYENGNWSRSWKSPIADPTQIGRAVLLPKDGDGRKGIWSAQRPRRMGGRTMPPHAEDDPQAAVYTILQAPLGLEGSTLFGVQEVERLAFISTLRPEQVALDRGDALVTRDLPPSHIKYRVTSWPKPRSLAAGEEAWLPTGTAARLEGDWLQLPSSTALVTRLREISTGVIARANAKTALEKCEALESFLQNQYTYTLEVTSGPKGSDPILHFLDVSKEGHCELAATAFVLMCRTQGMPARLVNGFQTGQWNDLAGYWQVRQMEAHAWAEVRFGGEAGWIEFDPTPWVGSGGSVLSFVEKWRDYLRYRWLNYVISYTLQDQLSFADRLKTRLQELQRDLSLRLRELRKKFPRLEPEALSGMVMKLAAVSAGALAIAFALHLRGLLANGAKRSSRAPQKRVPFFEQWVKAIERRGQKRAPAETPLELAARLEALPGDPGAAFAGSTALVETYNRVRFADAELDAPARDLVERVLAGLEAAERTGPGPRRP